MKKQHQKSVLLSLQMVQINEVVSKEAECARKQSVGEISEAR